MYCMCRLSKSLQLQYWPGRALIISVLISGRSLRIGFVSDKYCSLRLLSSRIWCSMILWMVPVEEPVTSMFRAEERLFITTDFLWLTHNPTSGPIPSPSPSFPNHLPFYPLDWLVYSEGEGFSKTLVYIHQSTCSHIPEDVLTLNVKGTSNFTQCPHIWGCH